MWVLYVELGKRLFYMCRHQSGVLLLTVGLHALTQLRLHLSVGPVSALLAQLPRHGGGRHDCLLAQMSHADPVRSRTPKTEELTGC